MLSMSFLGQKFTKSNPSSIGSVLTHESHHCCIPIPFSSHGFVHRHVLSNPLSFWVAGLSFHSFYIAPTSLYPFSRKLLAYVALPLLHFKIVISFNSIISVSEIRKISKGDKQEM